MYDEVEEFWYTRLPVLYRRVWEAQIRYRKEGTEAYLPADLSIAVVEERGTTVTSSGWADIRVASAY